MVWKYAISTPRTAECTMIELRGRGSCFGLFYDGGVPSLLHVNIESRALAKEVAEWNIPSNDVSSMRDLDRHYARDPTLLKFFREDQDIAHVSCGPQLDSSEWSADGVSSFQYRGILSLPFHKHEALQNHFGSGSTNLLEALRKLCLVKNVAIDREVWNCRLDHSRLSKWRTNELDALNC